MSQPGNFWMVGVDPSLFRAVQLISSKPNWVGAWCGTGVIIGPLWAMIPSLRLNLLLLCNVRKFYPHSESPTTYRAREWSLNDQKQSRYVQILDAE